MRIVALLLCGVQVYGLFGQWKSTENRTDRREHGVLGRAFVTMLGYPQKCERKGSSHSCTLSFTCWLAGGSSEEGCGSNPWLVGCCVIKKKGLLYTNQLVEHNEINEEVNLEAEGFLQRRNDDAEFECGISANRVLSKRIIGGKEAYFGQFPWQAHIKISAYQCGGVLVSSRYVATAAHCIIKAKLYDVVVYLGELDTQDTGTVTELAPAELHRIKNKIVHPKFQFRRTQPDRFDVALLELITEASYSFHIAPICLPEGNLDLRGREGIVAGWGKIKPSAELMGTNVLRSAIVPILDIQECITWHKTRQIQVELYEEMICAGHADGRHDACLGDSGGPLIVLQDGRWTLAGLISAGFGCGEPHQPGIYHSISTTSHWIKSIIYS